MKCKICGSRIPEGEKFCPACGTEAGTENIDQANINSSIKKMNCPSCGALVIGEHRFCSACGEKLPLTKLMAEEEPVTDTAKTSEVEIPLVTRSLVTEEMLLDDNDQDISEFTNSSAEDSPEPPVETPAENTVKNSVDNTINNSIDTSGSEKSNSLIKDKKQILNILIIVISVIAVIILSVSLNKAIEEKYYQSQLLQVEKIETRNLDAKLKEIKKDISDVENEISIVQKDYNLLEDAYHQTTESPLHVVIEDFRNEKATWWDKKMKHDEITFLHVDYKVYMGKDFKKEYSSDDSLCIKYIDPDGELMKGSVSKNGYSFFTVLDTTSIGWGTEKPGYYQKAGTYTVEFWYRDVCVGRKQVKLD